MKAPFRTGFDSIGNATILVYDDGKPVLATDPWLQGSSYFGSWGLSHEIPEAQLRAGKEAPYVWFSHGHPDHLNPDSLELFKGRTILLPDHVGGRIDHDLRAMGMTTKILPDREWVSLSPKVRILCIADYYQDAIILIDVNGRLLVNTNDAIDRGWGSFVRKTIKQFETSFLLALIGYGDADMINYYREDGTFITPKAALKRAVGAAVAQAADSYGVSYYIPFSTMHRYQRTDSIWAHAYTTPIEDFDRGFHSTRSKILPAFIRWNAEDDQFEKINPRANADIIHKPEDFGDSWSEPLSAEDRLKAEAYFRRIQHLATFLDFVGLRVGGEDFNISLNSGKHRRGVIFEVPRHSLMVALEYRIFDDLLIGNFMKTILVGDWPKSALYPDFTPFVARYSDNANVHSKEELHAYFNKYKDRNPFEFRRHQIEMKAIDLFRAAVSGDSALFQAGKGLYWAVKKRF